jgi:hypothetical protein
MLYRYRLYDSGGNEVGEAHYAVLIEPGETIWTGDAASCESSLVPVEDDEWLAYAGFLKVEST